MARSPWARDLDLVPVSPVPAGPVLPDLDADGDEIPPIPSPETEGLFALGPPASAPRQDFSWTNDQWEALRAVDDWLASTRGAADEYRNLFSLTGPAGTGKSVLVGEVRRRHPEAVLAAMTGKAAVRLTETTGTSATTLHRVLYFPPEVGAGPRFERLREPPSTFVVVDESSMVSPKILKDLRVWAQRGTRILLVGDGYQLPAVLTGEDLRNAGTDDYSVFSQVGGPALDTVMRSVGGVLRVATKMRASGDIVTQSDLDAPGRGYEFQRVRDPVKRAIDEYLADRDDCILITWRNSIRMNANDAIRARLGHEGPLPDEGEPVLIRRNGQGRMNGEIVIAGSFDDGPKIGSIRTLYMTTTSGEKLLVSVDGGEPEKGGRWMDGSMPWIEDWKKYQMDLKRTLVPDPLPITWGHCVTCHASQGSQARKSIVFLDRGDERNRAFRKDTTLPDGSTARFGARWAYTGVTRSREHTVMVLGS